LQLAARFHRG